MHGLKYIWSIIHLQLFCVLERTCTTASSILCLTSSLRSKRKTCTTALIRWDMKSCAAGYEREPDSNVQIELRWEGSEKRDSTMVLLLAGETHAAVHREAGCRFGSPAGHSGEIRIRMWTHCSQQCRLVIPISCVGACLWTGMQGGEGRCRCCWGKKDILTT